MQGASVVTNSTALPATMQARDFQDDLMMEVAGNGLGTSRETQAMAPSPVQARTSHSVRSSCYFV